MAYAANKKTQLIAINNPDLSGLPYQTNTVLSLSIDDKQRIEQGALPRLFKTLKSFENGLAEIIDSKNIFTNAPLKYKSIDFTQKIISDTELVIQAQYKAITLKNIETHLHKGTSYYSRNNNQSMVLENGINDIDFRIFDPQNIKSDIQLLVNEPSQIQLRILFDIPIETGTSLSYGYQRKHKNYIFYTYEEMEEAIKEGRMKNYAMIREHKIGDAFDITVPTDRLKINLEFPSKYPIKKLSPLVLRKDDVNNAETERVKELLIKEEDPFSGTIKLSIDIRDPRPTYSYFLLYEPPHISEIM